MRYIVAILLLFISFGAFAQKADSVELISSVADLNYALVNKDTVKLRFLLRDDVHYYHSNGWLELKRDVIDDLYNGKLSYKSIKAGAQSVRFTGSTIAQVKMIADVDVELNGKPIQLKLSVVQVWIWKNSHWSLYSRHSEKV